MKIEKISENQIKCTLTRSDLASRQLKLSELAYGTEKARGLFRDMMDQANLEFGFDADDIPLMIEAIPVSMDCIILMITKVDDPDEVDSRFSGLSSLKDMFAGAQGLDDLSDFSEETESALTQLGDLIRQASKEKESSWEFLCSFDSLDAVLGFAGHCKDIPCGDSSLYRSLEDGRYYLSMEASRDHASAFARLCTMALEFGKMEPFTYARAAYMNEHFETIINKDALRHLAYV